MLLFKTFSAIRLGGSLGETLKIHKLNLSPYLKLVVVLYKKKKKTDYKFKVNFFETFYFLYTFSAAGDWVVGISSMVLILT